MDNLTHTLAGLALAEAGLKRTTRWSTATLVIAANLPDVDGLSYLFGGRSSGLSFRRGWTHGVLAMALLPALLLLAVLGWQRCFARKDPRVRPGWLLLLAACGVWSHPLLDLLNTYGVRLLMPFSSHWFYGDALFILDPWLWLLLGAGILLSRWRSGRSSAEQRNATRPARLALLLAAGYAVLLSLGSRYAVGLAQRGGGAEASPILAAPVFGNPLRREIIRQAGNTYELGRVELGLPSRYLPGRRVSAGADAPGAARAAHTRAGAAFLRWARFPFFESVRVGDSVRVTISDMRYRGAENRTWASVTVQVAREAPPQPDSLP